MGGLGTRRMMIATAQDREAAVFDANTRHSQSSTRGRSLEGYRIDPPGLPPAALPTDGQRPK